MTLVKLLIEDFQQKFEILINKAGETFQRMHTLSVHELALRCNIHNHF